MVLPAAFDAQSFKSFIDSWFVVLGQHWHDMLGVGVISDGDNEQNEDACKDIMNRVIAHYGEYFVAQARVVRENVFLALTPPWLSSFERSHLWIGGFRPGLAFRILANNVVDLSGDQSQRINGLMAEIRDEEKAISDEFDRIQGVMWSPRMMWLAAQQVGRSENGMTNNVEAPIDMFRDSMETLVECADILRKKVGMMTIEILRGSQALRFLAAMVQLQLGLRRWGLHRDQRNQQATVA